MKILTPNAFYILIALGDGPLHGYGIMKQIKKSGNDIFLGTLYGSLKILLREGLVSYELANSPRQTKIYKITDHGIEAVQAELNRINSILDLAKRVGLR